MLVQAFNPSTSETQVGRLISESGLQIESHDSQAYTERPCLEKPVPPSLPNMEGIEKSIYKKRENIDMKSWGNPRYHQNLGRYYKECL